MLSLNLLDDAVEVVPALGINCSGINSHCVLLCKNTLPANKEILFTVYNYLKRYVDKGFIR